MLPRRFRSSVAGAGGPISDPVCADQPVNVIQPDHRTSERDILASRSASVVLLSGMATGQEPNSSAMTRAAILVLPTMEDPISKSGRLARR